MLRLVAGIWARLALASAFALLPAYRILAQQTGQPAPITSYFAPVDYVALLNHAINLAKANRPAEAESAYQQAVIAAASQYGPMNTGEADVIAWQAIFLRDQRRYEEAWDIANRGLRIRLQY